MINLKAVLAAVVLGIGICVAPTVRAQGDPPVVGEWSDIQTWPDAAIHSIMLPTRDVLFWGHDPDRSGFFCGTWRLIQPAQPPARCATIFVAVKPSYPMEHYWSPVEKSMTTLV